MYTSSLNQDDLAFGMVERHQLKLFKHTCTKEIRMPTQYQKWGKGHTGLQKVWRLRY